MRAVDPELPIIVLRIRVACLPVIVDDLPAVDPDLDESRAGFIELEVHHATIPMAAGERHPAQGFHEFVGRDVDGQIFSRTDRYGENRADADAIVDLAERR